MQNQNRTGGPKTQEGKNKCSKNALKAGIYSNNHLLSDESQIEYQNHYTEIIRAFKPKYSFEKVLVEELSILLWKKRRLLSFENGPIEAIKKEKLSPIQLREFITVPENCAWIISNIDNLDHEFIAEYQAIHQYFKTKKLEEFTFDEVIKLEQRCPVLVERLCEIAVEYFDTLKEIKGIDDIVRAIRNSPSEQEEDDTFLVFSYSVVESNLREALWVIERFEEIKSVVKVYRERRIMNFLINNKFSRPMDDLNRAISKVLEQLKMYRQNFAPVKVKTISKRTNSHLEKS